jgi:hypothetical protein
MDQQLETARTQCAACSASILIATAKRYLGRCRPCHLRVVENAIGRTEFGRAYARISQRPDSLSPFGFDVWCELELGVLSVLYQLRCGSQVASKIGMARQNLKRIVKSVRSAHPIGQRQRAERYHLLYRLAAVRRLLCRAVAFARDELPSLQKAPPN